MPEKRRNKGKPALFVMNFLLSLTSNRCVCVCMCVWVCVWLCVCEWLDGNIFSTICASSNVCVGFLVSSEITSHRALTTISLMAISLLSMPPKPALARVWRRQPYDWKLTWMPSLSDYALFHRLMDTTHSGVLIYWTVPDHLVNKVVTGNLLSKWIWEVYHRLKCVHLCLYSQFLPLNFNRIGFLTIFDVYRGSELQRWILSAFESGQSLR